MCFVCFKNDILAVFWRKKKSRNTNIKQRISAVTQRVVENFGDLQHPIKNGLSQAA